MAAHGPDVSVRPLLSSSGEKKGLPLAEAPMLDPAVILAYGTHETDASFAVTRLTLHPNQDASRLVRETAQVSCARQDPAAAPSS